MLPASCSLNSGICRCYIANNCYLPKICNSDSSLPLSVHRNPGGDFSFVVTCFRSIVSIIRGCRYRKALNLQTIHLKINLMFLPICLMIFEIFTELVLQNRIIYESLKSSNINNMHNHTQSTYQL
jgi:hypothetical protein